MQIHPHFKEYKELSRNYYCTDSRGIDYDIVEWEGMHEDSYLGEEKQSGVNVLSRNLIKYSNGATGYDERIFFKPDEVIKEKKIIGKYEITPFISGNNLFFSGGININTKVIDTTNGEEMSDIFRNERKNREQIKEKLNEVIRNNYARNNHSISVYS